MSSVKSNPSTIQIKPQQWNSFKLSLFELNQEDKIIIKENLNLNIEEDFDIRSSDKYWITNYRDCMANALNLEESEHANYDKENIDIVKNLFNECCIKASLDFLALQQSLKKASYALNDDQVRKWVMCFL